MHINVYVCLCLYICMYVCVHTYTHTHIYIYSYMCTQSLQCPDESKKDAGNRVEVPRMAPFPHCLGPVGSALPACPLKGLSLLSSEPSAWPSVWRGGTRGGWYPSTQGRSADTRKVCTGSQALRTAQCSNRPTWICILGEKLCACWGGGVEDSQGSPRRGTGLRDPETQGNPRRGGPVEKQSSQERMVRKDASVVG